MTESKPLRNATNLFQRINRLSSEAEWSESELLEALLQEGIDPTLFLESVRTNVKKLLRESPYYWRNRAAALRSKLKSTMFAAQRRQTQKLSRKESSTISRRPWRGCRQSTQEFSFEHRNFEVCSDEDLESILLELDCFIENLDAPNANE